MLPLCNMCHLGEMATNIVFWIYTTMHICKQEMASKIVFRLHNNAHPRARDGYKKILWIMQQCTSAPKDGYKRFVFGLCNMHAPVSSQHRREVVECDYTLHIALKVSPLKPNHPSSSSRIPAHRYSNQRSYHLHGKSGTVAIICYKNLKDCTATRLETCWWLSSDLYLISAYKFLGNSGSLWAKFEVTRNLKLQQSILSGFQVMNAQIPNCKD